MKEHSVTRNLMRHQKPNGTDSRELTKEVSRLSLNAPAASFVPEPLEPCKPFLLTITAIHKLYRTSSRSTL
jgi:hypothetical protein